MIHHSPNRVMLKPPITLVQGDEKHQVASNIAGIPRIASCPGPGSQKFLINEGSETCHIQPLQQQQHQQHVSISLDQTLNSNNQHVAAQRQNFQPRRQHQQDRSNAQEVSKIHSMDLISLGSTSIGHTYPNNLFSSSSDRTAHTAAAGDLLSMSYCALDTPLSSNPSNTPNKKRSATMVDGMYGSDVGRGTSTPGRYKNRSIMNHAVPLTTTHIPHSHTSHHLQNGAFIPNHEDTSYFNNSTQSQSTLTSSPLASTMDGSNDESYSNHRTTRQCLRSDSFEMMMDDC